MKAITIKQPWASLIVHGIKNIENRTWPCPKKYIGQRILIHASADKKVSWILNDAQRCVLSRSKSPLYSTDLDALPFGTIIGSVEIIRRTVNHPSIWAEKTENYTVGMNPKLHEATTGKKVIYNWVLANPSLFEKPIENVKGKLSFWDYDGGLPKGGAR